MHLHAWLFTLLIFGFADSAAAQLWPRGPARASGDAERFRIAITAGQQTTRASFAEEQRFDQYFEQGSFTFERTLDKAVFYDGAVSVRLWSRLHAGAGVSLFEDKGAGGITARVPHPLFFDKQRTTTGEVSNVTRREVGQHVSVGWVFPDIDGLDVMIFGGPSIITTDQMFVTTLTMSLEKEVFPFDSLPFPGTVTEKRREDVLGYHAGIDMTWRFSNIFGAGMLLRYTNGRKDFTPTGGAPVEIEVGGLHVGGGMRLMF